MKSPDPAVALQHVLVLADEYASTLCCHSKRQALEAIRVVREEVRKAQRAAQ